MRQFKTEFYGEEGEGKNIFVLNCFVVSQKRFNGMSQKDIKAAIKCIDTYQRSLQGFKEDISEKLTSNKVATLHPLTK